MNLFSRAFNKIRHHYFDEFVFIHINKTGGSSIESALKIPHEHLTVIEKKKQLGTNDWQRRLTFTVVRNPWDKVVSHYSYRVMTNQTGLANKKIDFETWLKKSYVDFDPEFRNNEKMFQTQVSWLVNENNEIEIDNVLRFESLTDDFNQLAAKLKINVSLPHLKKSKRNHYSEYYNDETKKIVSDYFAEDIEKFQYSYSDQS